MPHIVFFCSSDSWGGLEMNVLRFAEWMHEAGCQTHLCCVAGSPIDTHAAESTLQRIHISRNKKYFDLRNARKAAKILDNLKPDVVWIRDTRDMDLMAWCKRFTHHNYKLVYQQAMQLGVKKKDLFHTFRYKAIDHWIAPLNFLADQVKSMTHFSAEKISVIPLALEAERFNISRSQQECRSMLSVPLEGIYLGNIGRIDPLKGQEMLLNAFLDLASRHEDLHLLLVGDPTRNEGDAFLRQLLATAQASAYSDRIHILPHRNDVEITYKAIDIFAMTSVGETFGMVTIEAMASGLAVIGTNSSGTPELLEFGEAGLLYPPGDEEVFKAAVEELLNTEHRNKLGRKAEVSAQRFHKTEVIRQLLSVIGA